MKKMILLLAFLIIFSTFVIPFSFAQEQKLAVVMIIAQNNFRDEELFVPREFLESKGISVTVACSSKSTARGMFGKEVTPDITIDEVDMKKYDALILVGGIGASQYYSDKRVYAFAREANSSKKIIAAICLAPVTLANAGILKGKSATVFNSATIFLKKGKARYVDKPVVVDGNIITADGPYASKDFARAIYAALTNK